MVQIAPMAVVSRDVVLYDSIMDYQFSDSIFFFDYTLFFIVVDGMVSLVSYRLCRGCFVLLLVRSGCSILDYVDGHRLLFLFRIRGI